jgi:hypothetical protein
VPTYQPLGQSRDNVRHESCHSTYRQRTMPRPDHKGAKQGVAMSPLPADRATERGRSQTGNARGKVKPETQRGGLAAEASGGIRGHRPSPAKSVG